MGGAVSSGQNNDELIDNLKEAEYIKSPLIEQVFRMVDRAHYYLPECRESAYKDVAWKSGTLHLSAPCIYSEVMEALELKEGLSFLNLGSGTGYLNTMVGMIIGPYGVNHGIELHADNVTYANDKLESFIKEGPKFDHREFCIPQFVVGNCLSLAAENRLYDRLYCGASCPLEEKEVLQNMIKLDGILVVPVGDQLLKIKRISETEFTSENVLPVSFASLVLPPPKSSCEDPIVLPELNALSLQSICGIVIRTSIRKTFNFTLPSSSGTKKRPSRKTPLRLPHPQRCPVSVVPTSHGLMIMGTYGPSDLDEDDEEDDDDDDDDADESELSDGELLDLQLRKYAEIQNKRKLVTSQVEESVTDNVDSDLSGNEDEGVELGTSPVQDLNGNKSVAEARNSSYGEEMNIEQAVAGSMADEEEEEESKEEDVLNREEKKTGERKNGKKGAKQCSKSNLAEATGNENQSEKLARGPFKSPYDRLLAMISPPNMDASVFHVTSSESPSKATEGWTNCAENSQLNRVSPAIQVTPSSSSFSQPRSIRTSYSTSADTSETSGFGSLGDDQVHVGSHTSELESLKDEMETEEFSPSGSSSENKAELWRKNSEDKSSIELSTKDGSDTPDVGWMDIENDKDDDADEDIDVEGDCDEDDDEDDDDNFVNVRKQGMKPDSTLNEDSQDAEDIDSIGEAAHDPDFTQYLREKVDTLPIPSSLKAFILHYR